MSRSSRRKQRPTARFDLEGANVIETVTGRVIRMKRPAEGPDARRIVVLLEPDVTAEEAAGELRLIAGELARRDADIFTLEGSQCIAANPAGCVNTRLPGSKD